MIIYIILTIFFAMNFTLDSVERSKIAGIEIPLLMIVARFLLDAVIWPLRLMRLFWEFIRKFFLKIINNQIN